MPWSFHHLYTALDAACLQEKRQKVNSAKDREHNNEANSEFWVSQRVNAVNQEHKPETGTETSLKDYQEDQNSTGRFIIIFSRATSAGGAQNQATWPKM